MIEKKEQSDEILDSVLVNRDEEVSEALGIGLVSQLVESQIEMGTEIRNLQRELEALRQAVRVSELLFSVEENAILNSSKLPSVAILASDYFSVEDNYYAVEKRGKTMIRWTGPEKINVFRIPVDRSSKRQGTLYIANVIKDTILSGMRVYLDGELINYDILQDDNSYKVVFDLPVSNRLQDTVIAVYVDKLYSPKDISDSSSDTRLLGWAFRALEVK